MDTISFPLLPVRNAVIFPGVPSALTVGRSRSVAALKTAEAREALIVVVTQRENTAVDPERKHLYTTGTLSKIEALNGNERQGYHVIVKGISRFRIAEVLEAQGHFAVAGEKIDDRMDADESTIRVLSANLKALAAEILEAMPGEGATAAEAIRKFEDPVYITHLCSATLDFPLERKQELLEESSLRRRMDTLLELMRSQRETLDLQREIRDKLARRLTKEQRKALLREQIRTIREQLDEDDDDGTTDELGQLIERAGMPEDVEKIAFQELERLEQAGQSSPEAHIIRTYIDWLCTMPWKKAEAKQIDIIDAKRKLDEDHYGLDKVKDRMIEHLAVMKMKKDMKGPILCFLGPPGVGKTSLGQSIAAALGRSFVRVSLGGVRDDAEIRGHRRTYIGAMPGRLIQGIKRAKSSSPVFMLDEIDKLSFSYHGDPAAALLEALDPEQNRAFLDHYLDVPFDLSDVFFICTANNADGIPGPLRDRMEIIELQGYTTEEKIHIAERHLVPKKLEEHGLNPGQLELGRDMIAGIITSYTREAGVRELQRRIAAVCRAAAVNLVKDPEKQVAAQPEWIEKVLGPNRYEAEGSENALTPGVATGLAWTPHGGEILFVEASLMPGRGQLILTGQLGDVMKESARIALSSIRARIGSAGQTDFDKQDVHVHVPGGAIPKDGPSAGVAILSALASSVLKQSIDPKLAMTGEITLRGAILPVGGIKEKVLGAHRAGIRRVILPRKNTKDLYDVPEDVKREMKFVFVDTVEHLLDIVLGIRLNTLNLGIQTSLGGQLPAGAPHIVA